MFDDDHGRNFKEALHLDTMPWRVAEVRIDRRT